MTSLTKFKAKLKLSLAPSVKRTLPTSSSNVPKPTLSSFNFMIKYSSREPEIKTVGVQKPNKNCPSGQSRNWGKGESEGAGNRKRKEERKRVQDKMRNKKLRQDNVFTSILQYPHEKARRKKIKKVANSRHAMIFSFFFNLSIHSIRSLNHNCCLVSALILHSKTLTVALKPRRTVNHWQDSRLFD